MRHLDQNKLNVHPKTLWTVLNIDCNDNSIKCEFVWETDIQRGFTDMDPDVGLYSYASHASEEPNSGMAHQGRSCLYKRLSGGIQHASNISFRRENGV